MRKGMFCFLMIVLPLMALADSVSKYGDGYAKQYQVTITVYEGIVDNDADPIYGYGSVYCNGVKQVYGRERQSFLVNEGDSAIIRMVPDPGHIINSVSIQKQSHGQQDEYIEDKNFEPYQEKTYRFANVAYDLNVIVYFKDYNYWYAEADVDSLSFHFYPASHTAELSRMKYYSEKYYPDSIPIIQTDCLILPDTIIYQNEAYAVTAIGKMALLHSRIGSLVISPSVKRIKGDAFFECVGMTKLVIPPSITKIDKYAFRCCRIDSVIFQKQSDSISISTSLFAAYDARTKVKYVRLPEDIQEIPDQMFFNCDVEDVVIPSSVKTVGRQAFEYSNIHSIVIPEGVTELQFQSFYCCKNLKLVTLPESLTYIGQQVFGETEMDTIHCLGAVPPFIEENAFSSNVGYEKRYPLLIVPNGSKEVYQNAMIWKECQILEESEVTAIRPTMTDQNNPRYYSINGQRMNLPKKGISIIRRSDGTTRKEIVR